MWDLVDSEQSRPFTRQNMMDFNGPFPQEDYFKGQTLKQDGSMIPFDESSYSDAEVAEILGPEAAQTLRRMKIQKAMNREPQSVSPFVDDSSQVPTREFNPYDMPALKSLERDPISEMEAMYYINRAGKEDDVQPPNFEMLRLLRDSQKQKGY